MDLWYHLVWQLPTTALHSEIGGLNNKTCSFWLQVCHVKRRPVGFRVVPSSPIVPARSWGCSRERHVCVDRLPGSKLGCCSPPSTPTRTTRQRPGWWRTRGTARRRRTSTGTDPRSCPVDGKKRENKNFKSFTVVRDRLIRRYSDNRPEIAWELDVHNECKLYKSQSNKVNRTYFRMADCFLIRYNIGPGGPQTELQ